MGLLDDIGISGRPGAVFGTGDGSSLSTYQPTYREMISSGIQDLLERTGLSRANAQHYGEGVGGLAGAIPGVGTVMAGQEFYRHPTWGGAANLAMSAIPDAAAMSRFGRAAPIGPYDTLPNAPDFIHGPIPEVVDAAHKYAAERGIDLTRQNQYDVADPRRGSYIAKAYEAMPHDPNNPAVAASYQALSDETVAQYKALKDAGIDIDFIKRDQADPYPKGPTQAVADLRNNKHLWVFPTESGFGTINEISDNPLLASTGIKEKGHDVLVNDAFRAVHDVFGHGMEGANFGARGEENAWRAHSRLFSPEALPAATSETRGQNSWVNFGPFGEANRANQRNTVFADQKTGLMPPWTYREGGMPPAYRAQQLGLIGTMMAMTGLGGSSDGRR